jgi:hypothetical protein
MPRTRSRRARLAELAAGLRADGQSWAQIAARIAHEQRVNARVAMRLAHGWTQRHVAGLWNQQWPPDDGGGGISDKHVSYWETWPQSGHEPSLRTYKRLAQLYQCDAGDLIDGGRYSYLDDVRHADSAADTAPVPDKAETVPAVRESDAASCPPALSSPLSELASLFIGQDIAPLLPYLYELRLLSAQPFGSAQERERAYDHLIAFLSRWADTMKRRELLRLLGWAASYVVAAPVLPGLDSDEAQRVTSGIAVPARIDATAIDHIEAVLWHAKRQDDLLGPQAALHTVLSQRNIIRWVLKDCPASLRPRVLSVLSSASRIAGWLSFDLGDYQGAWFYYEQARSAAHEACNSVLAGYVLCNMSHLATWQGTPRLGIDHAVAAQGWAAQTDDAPLKAYARQVAARAYAADHQERALSELDRAEGYLSDVSDCMSVAHFNDRALLVSDQSGCQLLLGRPWLAACSALQALELTDSSFVRNRAFATLDLGRARLQTGEVVEAAKVVGDAVELARCNRSPRFVDELRGTVHELEPWRNERVVRDLQTRCIETGIIDKAGSAS